MKLKVTVNGIAYEIEVEVEEQERPTLGAVVLGGGAAAPAPTPASVRATGTGINVLLIHLLGDALSPALVGRVSEAGGAGGAALGRAMLLVIPAIAASALALLWARRRPVPA